MLTAADLAGMRAAAQALLQPGFSISNVSRSLDRYGRESISYTVASTVAGLLESTSGSERALLAAQVDGGVLKAESARLKVPHGTAVTTAQVVRSPDGRSWNVAHVNTDSLAAFTVALLTLQEVQ